MAQNNQQQDTGGQGGGGETSQFFIFHGVNLGQIMSIGQVSDYFPEGATNVPSVEQTELSTYMNPIAAGAHRQMMRYCLENPGYLVSMGGAGYGNALGNPLDEYGDMSQAEWNSHIFSTPYEGSEKLVFDLPAQNNTWNWSSYYQVLLAHNRVAGLPALLDEQNHQLRCKQIIKGTNGSLPYEIISPDTNIIHTRILIRDWRDTQLNTTHGYLDCYWVATTLGHIEGLTGVASVDYQLIDTTGVPIPFSSLPGTDFADQLSTEWTNSEGHTFGGDMVEQGWYQFYNMVLPDGMPKLAVPFLKPLSVSFDDTFPDNHAYNFRNYIIYPGEPKTMPWPYETISISDANLPVNPGLLQIVGEGQGSLYNGDYGGWIGSIDYLQTGHTYTFITTDDGSIPGIYFGPDGVVVATPGQMTDPPDPDNYQGFRTPKSYSTYPKQHNPTNNVTDGAPNKGWYTGDEMTDEIYQSYLDDGGTGGIHGALIWTWDKQQKWMERYRLFGFKPQQFALDGLYLQDYDFAGVWEYDAVTRMPTNFSYDTWYPNWNIINQIIDDETLPLVSRQRAAAMKHRLARTGYGPSYPSTEINAFEEEANFFGFESSPYWLGTPVRNSHFPLGIGAPIG